MQNKNTQVHRGNFQKPRSHANATEGTFHVKWDQKYTISDLNSLDFFQIQHSDTTLDTIMQEKIFSQKVSQPVNYTHSKFWFFIIFSANLLTLSFANSGYSCPINKQFVSF